MNVMRVQTMNAMRNDVIQIDDYSKNRKHESKKNRFDAQIDGKLCLVCEFVENAEC